MESIAEESQHNGGDVSEYDSNFGTSFDDDSAQRCATKVLQAALDMRKGKTGLWKRHYVIFELSDDENTITCHRSMTLSRHPTRLDPIALRIPNSAQWTYLEDKQKGKFPRFIISIVTGEDNDDIEEHLDDNESSTHSEVAAGNNFSPIHDSYDKDYEKAKSKNKSLRYYFRFTHYQCDKEIQLWISTLETGYIDCSGFFRKSNLYTDSNTTKSLSSNVEAEFLAKKDRKDLSESFPVHPDYAYPNTRMNREELRNEMNKESAIIHDLRVPSRRGDEIGLVKLEILQCIGLPRLDKLGEGDIFVMASCGSYAFRTDIIEGNANPMWLSKMRRACIFPIYHAYSRLYIGVFDDDGKGQLDDFAGRVVLDLARMRPATTYEVTLPLRESAHVYTARKRGALRIRFHIDWHSQRDMVLSYLPKSQPVERNGEVVINCCDAKSFQNVARLVHGRHMQGKFSVKEVKAVIRELNFTRIHILRYMLKGEARRLLGWHSPLISGFVFVAWMHSIYNNTVRYIPGHLVTLLLLYLWRNYARYAIDNPVQNGFLAPTWEELFAALVWGKGNKSQCIKPIHDQLVSGSPEDNDSKGATETRLLEIAKKFKQYIRVRSHRYRFRTYKNTFTGNQAVDCLVNTGCATSREDAVKVGQELAEKLKLFQHITKEHVFMDKNHFYCFLEGDENTYILKTHRPWGRPLFWLFGFTNEEENFTHDQLEMPFSNGVEHPRRTVKGSLYIRRDNSKVIKREKKLLDIHNLQKSVEKIAHINEEDNLQKVKHAAESALDFEDNSDDEDGEDGHHWDSLTMEKFFNADVKSEQRSKAGSSKDKKHAFSRQQRKMAQFLNSDTRSDSGSVVEEIKEQNLAPPVQRRKKPPHQNIDIKTKADKPIGEVLALANFKVRKALLHLFNDKTYVIQEGEETAHLPGTPRRRREQNREDMGINQDHHDKLLKTGIYSNTNKYVNKIGVIVQ